jgi:hypothetical protein
MIRRFIKSSRSAFVAALALVVAVNAARAADGPVAFAQKDDRIEIAIAGAHFATYVFNDAEIMRPYFMSVKAPGGIQATRNQPPIAGTDLMDHPTFHPGIWLAFGDLSGTDDWRLKAPVKHAEFVEKPTTSATGGSFKVRNRYLKAPESDEAVCDELFRCRVEATDAGYLILWDSTFSSDNEFYFGDQEEMGLGVRVATAIRAQNKPDSGVPAGNGTITNAERQINEAQVWGKASDWCDYSGTIDGKHVGMTIMCHPDNFRPSWFHARDRGLLEANPFGEQAFTDGGPSKVVVKPGKSLRLRYGILVHAADSADAIDLKAAYADYLKREKGNK